ncbi:MAG: hypothetical protein HYU75_10025, partial [Betaproteobacteria bacterium]|nr:hypothetical protein [Betaproteobacteria bacterium]
MSVAPPDDFKRDDRMRFDFTAILSGEDLVEHRSGGSAIFNIGDAAEALYVVTSGQAE